MIVLWGREHWLRFARVERVRAHSEGVKEADSARAAVFKYDVSHSVISFTGAQAADAFAMCDVNGNFYTDVRITEIGGTEAGGGTGFRWTITAAPGGTCIQTFKYWRMGHVPWAG